MFLIMTIDTNNPIIRKVIRKTLEKLSSLSFSVFLIRKNKNSSFQAIKNSNLSFRHFLKHYPNISFKAYTSIVVYPQEISQCFPHWESFREVFKGYVTLLQMPFHSGMGAVYDLPPQLFYYRYFQSFLNSLTVASFSICCSYNIG